MMQWSGASNELEFTHDHAKGQYSRRGQEEDSLQGLVKGVKEFTPKDS